MSAEEENQEQSEVEAFFRAYGRKPADGVPSDLREVLQIASQSEVPENPQEVEQGEVEMLFRTFGRKPPKGVPASVREVLMASLEKNDIERRRLKLEAKLSAAKAMGATPEELERLSREAEEAEKKMSENKLSF